MESTSNTQNLGYIRVKTEFINSNIESRATSNVTPIAFDVSNAKIWEDDVDDNEMTPIYIADDSDDYINSPVHAPKCEVSEPFSWKSDDDDDITPTHIDDPEDYINKQEHAPKCKVNEPFLRKADIADVEELKLPILNFNTEANIEKIERSFQNSENAKLEAQYAESLKELAMLNELELKLKKKKHKKGYNSKHRDISKEIKPKLKRQRRHSYRSYSNLANENDKEYKLGHNRSHSRNPSSPPQCKRDLSRSSECTTPSSTNSSNNEKPQRNHNSNSSCSPSPNHSNYKMNKNYNNGQQNQMDFRADVDYLNLDDTEDLNPSVINLGKSAEEGFHGTIATQTESIHTQLSTNDASMQCFTKNQLDLSRLSCKQKYAVNLCTKLISAIPKTAMEEMQQFNMLLETIKCARGVDI